MAVSIFILRRCFYHTLRNTKMEYVRQLYNINNVSRRCIAPGQCSSFILQMFCAHKISIAFVICLLHAEELDCLQTMKSVVGISNEKFDGKVIPTNDTNTFSFVPVIYIFNKRITNSKLFSQ